jgi:hypothetical protein
MELYHERIERIYIFHCLIILPLLLSFITIYDSALVALALDHFAVFAKLR